MWQNPVSEESFLHIVNYILKTDGEDMQGKLPYYMVYPMPFVYDDGRVDERDIEYMKSLYPDVAKRILPYVEEECDRMEYQNSMMYDEYPDKLQLRMMCGRVYNNVKNNEKIFFGTGYEDMISEETEELAVNSQQMRGAHPSRPPYPPRPPQPPRPPHPSRPPHSRRPDWLRDMIEIMLYQELMRRRRDNRKNRGRFY